mgnify:CR=1 FL=1
MNYIIKINGYQLELDEGVDFERVIQRNTIGNLADRQSSFTSTIKVYKNGKNYQFFQFIDVAGVNSDLPYIVLRAEVLNDAGMMISKRGRAFIENTDQNYIYLNVYDGYIDFLKQIENKTLDDLNLSKLNHDKSINSVIDSWNDNEKYIYLISDFNGNNLHNNKLSIDYQLPSASIKYIWEKIFDFTGYTYNTEGVFNTPNFKDLYISYPKPITSDVQVLPVLEQKNNFQYVIGAFALDFSQWSSDLKHPWILPQAISNQYFTNQPKTEPTLQGTDPGQPNLGNRLYPETGIFEKTGIYRLSILGRFYIENEFGDRTVVSNVYYNVYDQNYNSKASGIIGSIGADIESSVDIQVIIGDLLTLYVANKFTDTDNDIQDQINTGLTAYLHDRGGNSAFLTSNNGETNLGITTKLEFFDSQSVDFANVFGKIKIRDFLNDMMFRFGLTPFPDHKRKHIDFLLQESVFLSDVADYSNNFIREEETRFAYNDYAQKNYFRYEYNDKEANHNDGAINVNNENIKFEKELYKSFFYSPGKGESEILGNQLLKSKTWDRKIDEDSNVEYEELDGRYYIFKKELVNQSINLSSVELGNSGSSSSFYKASFSQIDYDSILNGSYYRFTDKVIKNSKVRNVILYLTDLEFINVDLKKRIYLKQYSSNFLINRIKDRSGESEYSFELIEINI